MDSLLPHGAACDPDEKTVISQRPPLPAAGPARPTAPFELGQLLVGEKLNHFELKQYVGGGGMGAVFRALDTMLNREVALKVLSRDQGADEETRRRFQNEAQSAARLDHENIARVYFVGEDKGLNYIVFEFIEGTNLRELVEQKGTLPLPEAVSYTLQIAEALAHACSRDVVHRDIKPSNVIITADGRAKLVDMGLARLHQVQADGDELTASGVTLGTFDYISPEQARDPRSADVRSDIYSLGCTLYFMLTARPPFPDGTVLQKLLQHNSDAPPDPRELNPALPEEVSVVVRKLLAKDPRRRPQHPRDLIGELYALAEQVGFAVSAGKSSHWAPPAAAQPSWIVRHLPWMLPVAALFGGVAIIESFSGRFDSLAAIPIEQARAAGAADLPAWPTSPRAREAEKLAAPPAPVGASGSTARSQGERSASRTQSAEGEASSGESASDASPAANADNAAADDAAEVDHAPAPETDDGPLRTEPAAGPGALDGPATAQGSTRAHGRADDRVDDRAEGETDNVASKTTASSTRAADSPPAKRAAADLPPSVPDANRSTSAAPLPANLLVVASEPRGDRYYPTLRAACAAAKSGDVIELRYDGAHDETPFTLSNLRLTVRAGAKFRPTIVFRPSDTDAVAYPRSMITVAGGSLTLAGVAIELDMPRTLLSENWALVETQRTESLLLERCALTVRNASDQGGAYHLDVAFFDVKAAAGSDAMLLAMGMTPPEPVKIALTDCIARGEAVFLRGNDLQPFELAWNNGLLATSERLLALSGGVSAPPTGTGRVRVDLAHLTAAVGKGLCRLAAGDGAAWLPDVEISCADSIVVAAEKEAALVEQLGADEVDKQQRRVAWRGNHNVYQGFDSYWRVTDLTSAAAPLSLSFEQWTAYWSTSEVLPSGASVSWARPVEPARPLHRRRGVDYRLDAHQDRAVLSGASDGRPLGLIAERLPDEPPP